MNKEVIHLLPYSVQLEFKTHIVPHHASYYVPSIGT